jgi:hypothetical protein
MGGRLMINHNKLTNKQMLEFHKAVEKLDRDRDDAAHIQRGILCHRIARVELELEELRARVKWAYAAVEKHDVSSNP